MEQSWNRELGGLTVERKTKKVMVRVLVVEYAVVVVPRAMEVWALAMECARAAIRRCRAFRFIGGSSGGGGDLDPGGAGGGG